MKLKLKKKINKMGKLIYNIANSENKKYFCNGKMYNIWYNMIKRCYSNLSCYIAYRDCSVVDEWLNFETFADWFKIHHINGFELDKDILIKGNKIYSPETCCFVPIQINSLILTNKSRRGKLPIGIKQNISGNFVANITKNKQKFHLGTYKDIDEAFNIYKIEKEKYIKEVAEIWKNKISDKVYQALLNYNIEITD